MASPALVDQVLDYYYDLFDGVFANRFGPEIPDRIKRDQMTDRVKTAGRAASESLIRYLQRRRVSNAMVAEILGGFASTDPRGFVGRNRQSKHRTRTAGRGSLEHRALPEQRGARRTRTRLSLGPERHRP